MVLRLNERASASRTDGSNAAALGREEPAEGVLGKIELHTNAVALTEQYTRVALNRASTPQVWHLTMDAAHRHTYRRIKGRDHFDQVERSVEQLIAMKGELGATWPRVVLQFIVSDRNADEAELFQARWSRVLRRAGLRVTTAAGHVWRENLIAIINSRVLIE